MELAQVYFEFNARIQEIKDIYERLKANAYITEYTLSNLTAMSNQYNQRSYSTLNENCLVLQRNVNACIDTVYQVGFVDQETGLKVTSSSVIPTLKLSILSVEKQISLFLNQIDRDIKAVSNVVTLTNGKETPVFEILPKDSWRVITGKTGNGSRYWRTEIKNAKIGVGFAHDIATGDISEYETTQEFAKRHNLPVVSNASRFSYNASGAVATKGKPQAKRMHKGKVFARNWNDNYTQYLTIEDDGKTLGVKPNGVDFKNGEFEEVLLAFYPLFEDGEPSARPVVDTKYESELSEQPRQILYQLQDNTFGILTISARVDGDKGASYEQMIEELQKIGNVKFAYNLDGGGSAANVIEGEMLNPTFDPRSPDGRPVQDFIYFYSDQIEDPVTSTVIPLDD